MRFKAIPIAALLGSLAIVCSSCPSSDAPPGIDDDWFSDSGPEMVLQVQIGEWSLARQGRGDYESRVKKRGTYEKESEGRWKFTVTWPNGDKTPPMTFKVDDARVHGTLDSVKYTRVIR